MTSTRKIPTDNGLDYTNGKVNAATIGNIATGINGVKAILRKLYNYYTIHGFRALITKVIKKIFSPKIPEIENKDLYASQYHEMLNTAQSIHGKEFIPYSDEHIYHNKIDVKLIAFYLPQFHSIPENDEWWGKGFTEWANVSKAIPQFVGHYQPHLPGELGFYDLRVPEVQRRQVELAKNYGLFGFCFYYYWFKGKKLLERPLEQFILDPEINFPFCICWANENWTRRWDGSENEILIAQEHTPETDLQFIHDVIPIFKSKNYITIDGHPLLIIYRVQLMPDPQKTAKLWREECREAGLKEPYLVAAQTFGFIDPREVDFDAAVEFPPNNNPKVEKITDQVTLLNQKFTGSVYRYSGSLSLSEAFLNKNPIEYKVFKCVAPSWDNEPRKPGRGVTYAFSTPDDYKNWLKAACNIARRNSHPDERIVFINAWNEWGEGAYLEPDRKFGYAYLQATFDTVKEFSSHRQISNSNWMILFVLHDANIGGAQILIEKIISWFYEHTSINIKILLLAGGPMLPQFSILGGTLLLEDTIQLSNDEFVSKIINLCGGKPDLIYGNTVAVGKIYGFLQLLRSPIITHIHELEASIKRYAMGWIDTLCKNSDHFISVSDAVSENLQVNHNIPAELISKVYGGIPNEVKNHSLDKRGKQLLRNRLKISLDKKVIIGCGLGMPFRKGADLFIQVSKGIQQRLPGQTKFYWIGDFSPDEYDEEMGFWRDQLQAISNDNNIQFLGFQKFPQDYMQVADLFLLTSREDPFPLVVLEAAQNGLPIICFDKSGGAGEFVKDEAGAVVPFGNVDEMVTASERILLNEDLRVSLGKKAQQKVSRYHTIDAVAPQILSVCRKIAKKKPEVSVILPNYNHAKYLPERLNSIFNQTFRDFEVIILDDASTDNSLEVIQEYSDRSDVQIIQNASNSGTPFHQWIKGLELAKADIIWIAESDDRCEPDFLSTLLPAFNNPKVKLAYANSHIINENGEVVGDYPNTEYLFSLSTKKWKTDYLVPAEQEIGDGLGVKNTILNISAVLFRKFPLDHKFQGSLQEMHIAGDWYFLVHAIMDGYVYYDAKHLNSHRRHLQSVIGKMTQDKNIKDFYKEFSETQKYIFLNYQLPPGFLEKWEDYMHHQWNDFFPERDFNDLEMWYPLGEMKALINRNLLQKNV